MLLISCGGGLWLLLRIARLVLTVTGEELSQWKGRFFLALLPSAPMIVGMPILAMAGRHGSIREVLRGIQFAMLMFLPLAICMLGALVVTTRYSNAETGMRMGWAELVFWYIGALSLPLTAGNLANSFLLKADQYNWVDNTTRNLAEKSRAELLAHGSVTILAVLMLAVVSGLIACYWKRAGRAVRVV